MASEILLLWEDPSSVLEVTVEAMDTVEYDMKTGNGLITEICSSNYSNPSDNNLGKQNEERFSGAGEYY